MKLSRAYFLAALLSSVLFGSSFVFAETLIGNPSLDSLFSMSLWQGNSSA